MATTKTTLLQEVQKADPKHNQESLRPTEYEFSNGRVFKGYYKQRGAYEPEE